MALIRIYAPPTGRRTVGGGVAVRAGGRRNRGGVRSPVGVVDAGEGDVVGSRADGPRSPAVQPLYAAEFTAVEVAAVRARVEELAARVGLGQPALGDWVTAVNELLTNAVRHGGGSGRLCLEYDGRPYDGTLRCEIRDDGDGFAVEDYLGRSARPRVSAAGGMGLWIVQQMTDALTIDSGPTGTTACVTVEVRGAP
jgi:anti-sigma regulatory factor (Ser/Thr protein kinase)